MLPTRDDNGKLPAFAWPGGYPIVYFTRDGMTVCPDCANRETDAAQAPVSGDIYWEGPAMSCDDCGAEIESAYGDPDGERESCEECGGSFNVNESGSETHCPRHAGQEAN